LAAALALIDKQKKRPLDCQAGRRISGRTPERN